MKPSPLYKNITTGQVILDKSEAASYKGVALKTAVFLAMNLVGALLAYFLLPMLVNKANATGDAYPLSSFLIAVVISSIVAFIFGLIGRFSSRTTPVTGTIYSVAIGFTIGALTSIVDHYMIRFAGVICILGTFVIYGVMLLLFATGVVKPSNKLRAVVLGLLISGLLLALATLIFGLVMRGSTGYNSEWGYSTYLWMCIGVEVFFLLYGVITLTYNFCEAQAVVAGGSPKKEEWNVALGMEISLVYIYMELLRLLILIAQLADRK